MTILERIKSESIDRKNPTDQNTSTTSSPTPTPTPSPGPIEEPKKLEQDSSQSTTEIENQFRKILQEFTANSGFRVNTSEPPADTTIEILSSKGVVVSIAILLSYIRYCVNRGMKKDITLKIGYNRPPSVPMNFSINDELLEEIYPGDVVEIN